MKPEQLKYIRDWAKDGNAWKRPCLCTGMPMDVMRERWGGMDGNELQLNSAGLTIAKLADALEQANETAESGQWCLMMDTAARPHKQLTTMRANRKELLGC